MQTNLMAQMAQQAQLLQNIANQITQLKQQQTADATVAATPTPQTTPIAPTPAATPIDDPVRRPKPILPDLECYDGVDKAAYNVFRAHLTTKLEIDHLALSSYYNCMWYAFTRLKDQAATAMSPWMD
jgi:hypothetical protein